MNTDKITKLELARAEFQQLVFTVDVHLERAIAAMHDVESLVGSTQENLEQALTNMGKPEKLGTPDISHLRKAWRLSAACRALYTAIEEALEEPKEEPNGGQG